MGFSKLDSGITKSSIWSQDLHIRVVWIAFLAEKDESGFVSASRSGMQRICNVTPDQFDEAIAVLEAPDADSRTPDNDGRRIEKIDGGWIVLNHDKYRLKEEVKKEQTRERVRRFRERNHQKEQDVTPGNVTSTLPSVSVSVSGSVSGSEKDKRIVKGKRKKPFAPPSLEEFTAYCTQNGFAHIAKRIYMGYAEANWNDSRGNPVRNWKLKLQHVWFNDSNRFNGVNQEAEDDGFS